MNTIAENRIKSINPGQGEIRFREGIEQQFCDVVFFDCNTCFLHIARKAEMVERCINRLLDNFQFFLGEFHKSNV